VKLQRHAVLALATAATRPFLSALGYASHATRHRLALTRAQCQTWPNAKLRGSVVCNMHFTVMQQQRVHTSQAPCALSLNAPALRP
jgi:hypothetical protein